MTWGKLFMLSSQSRPGSGEAHEAITLGTKLKEALKKLIKIKYIFVQYFKIKISVKKSERTQY
jgi:hypothetical protein